MSAPSGAGKTTISRAALKAVDGLEPSISLTTRRPRDGETDGVDYHFVTDEEFKRRLDQHELAEWARVFDARYGTPKAPLDRAIASGRDILLDIDVQGGRQIRRNYPHDSVTIFVLPPSFAELEGRLRGRATEAEKEIQYRLKRAREEALEYPEYDYLIINREVADSLDRLRAVVYAERLKVSRLSKGFVPWKS